MTRPSLFDAREKRHNGCEVEAVSLITGRRCNCSEIWLDLTVTVCLRDVRGTVRFLSVVLFSAVAGRTRRHVIITV